MCTMRMAFATLVLVIYSGIKAHTVTQQRIRSAHTPPTARPLKAIELLLDEALRNWFQAHANHNDVSAL